MYYPNFLFRYCKQVFVEPISTTMRPTTTYEIECRAPGNYPLLSLDSPLWDEIPPPCQPGEMCILGRCKPGCTPEEPCPIGMECKVWVYKKYHYKKQLVELSKVKKRITRVVHTTTLLNT